MSKYCSKCGAELDDDADFCSECGNKINEVPNTHFTVNKKLIYAIIIIILIAIVGIFAYNTITKTNALSEVIDSATADKVWVTDWNNDFWDDEDKILYVTFTPTRDINNSDGGEVGFDEVMVTYSDGSSEKIISFVGEWCRDKVLYTGESYTTGIAFESNGKTPTHVSGKLLVYHHNGENASDIEKEVILHIDSDV